MTVSVGADGGKGVFMFDLDHIASQLPEWDFPVTIGGTSYPTRALTQGDMRFMADLQAGGVAETGRVLAFINSLFPAAKSVEFLVEHLQGVIVSLMTIAGIRTGMAIGGLFGGPGHSSALLQVARRGPRRE
jgi:hypothetical protein